MNKQVNQVLAISLVVVAGVLAAALIVFEANATNKAWDKAVNSQFKAPTLRLE